MTFEENKNGALASAIFFAGRVQQLLVYGNLDDLFLNRIRN
jgi:hypothetical protein